MRDKDIRICLYANKSMPGVSPHIRSDVPRGTIPVGMLAVSNIKISLYVHMHMNVTWEWE